MQQLEPPMPHQFSGAAFMAANDSTCVFDGAGTGKTRMTVMALDKAKLRKTLIIAPAQVKQHWRREFERFSIYNRSVKVVDGFIKNHIEEDVTIISHAVSANKKSVEYLKQFAWDAIIVDEAHEFKSLEAKRTENVFGESGLWKNANAVWPLTGSPFVNSAADVYPIISSSLSRRTNWHPSYWEFCGEFCEMKRNFMGHMVPARSKNEDKLAEFMKPFVLRRENVIDIPLRIVTVPVKIADSDLKPILDELQGYSPQQIEECLVNDMNMQQMPISRVRHAMGIAKAEASAQYILYLLQILFAGPLVVFFIHRKVREIIAKVLTDAGVRVAWIDGSTSAPPIQEAYQKGQLDVVLVQTQSGGTGLTLTKGSRCLVAEVPWTAVALEQEIKRVHRKTQERAVLAEVLYAADCWLEQLIADIISAKTIMALKINDNLTETVAWN